MLWVLYRWYQEWQAARMDTSQGVAQQSSVPDPKAASQYVSAPSPPILHATVAKLQAAEKVLDGASLRATETFLLLLLLQCRRLVRKLQSLVQSYLKRGH
jgi:hypothetical protein